MERGLSNTSAVMSLQKGSIALDLLLKRTINEIQERIGAGFTCWELWLDRYRIVRDVERDVVEVLFGFYDTEVR